MRKFAILSALILSAGLALADEEFHQVIKPKDRLSKRVFFILDVSGSMHPTGKISKIFHFMREQIQAPIDDMEIAIVAFNSSPHRWPGLADDPTDPKPVPPGWAKLPSQIALKFAQGWLSQFTGDGGTKPEAAFEIALSEERSDMSIIFMTDGDYDGGPRPLSKLIEEKQSWRKEKGLGEAVILTIGINDDEVDCLFLSEIGRKWNGGYFSDHRILDDIIPVKTQ